MEEAKTMPAKHTRGGAPIRACMVLIVFVYRIVRIRLDGILSDRGTFRDWTMLTTWAHTDGQVAHLPLGVGIPTVSFIP